MGAGSAKLPSGVYFNGCLDAHVAPVSMYALPYIIYFHALTCPLWGFVGLAMVHSPFSPSSFWLQSRNPHTELLACLDRQTDRHTDLPTTTTTSLYILAKQIEAYMYVLVRAHMGIVIYAIPRIAEGRDSIFACNFLCLCYTTISSNLFPDSVPLGIPMYYIQTHGENLLTTFVVVVAASS